MPIEKLIVEEFEAGDGETLRVVPRGFKFSYFKDPVTDKYYRPKASFEVSGENLEDLFEEVVPQKRSDWKVAMRALPTARTDAGYVVQLPDGRWMRTNVFKDWYENGGRELLAHEQG